MAKRKRIKKSERKEQQKDPPPPPPAQEEQDVSEVHNDDRTATTTNGAIIPIRDITQLFASPDTVTCALKKKCVPCAYKIGLFDVALDKEFCQKVPNQRPEQCPRLMMTTTTKSKKKPLSSRQSTVESPFLFQQSSYLPGMSVLTVGDGDFSFSLAVARILFAKSSTESNQEESRTSSRLLATSYESEETLRRVYSNIGDTIEELLSLGADIRYQVDATKLDDATLFSEDQKHISRKFDRICWNFPCSAIENGQDGQNRDMEYNKDLVRNFVKSAMSYLGDGEIHLCHKTKPPYNQWKLEEVVMEASDSTLQYAGRIVLDRALLCPYIPRKALDRKSFPCHDACFYVFTKSDSHSKTDYRTQIMESKVKTKTFSDHKTSPIPVTEELIVTLRHRCLHIPSKAKHQGRYGRSSKRVRR